MLGIRIFVSKVSVMRIEDLKIFVDVVRYHSMNIAAEKNFTTPQNLSKIIKRMEDELGVILFKRSKRGSDLTMAGERFYLQIIEVIQSYDEAVSALNGESIIHVDTKNCNQKNFNVLCTQGVLSEAIISIYNIFQKKRVSITLEEEEINFSDSNEIVNYVKNKDYDFFACLVQQEDIDFLTKNLEKFMLVHVILDEIVLIVSNENPLSQRSVISTSELSGVKMITFYDDFYKDLDALSDFSGLKTNSVTKALEIVRQSDTYCTLLSKSLVDMDHAKLGRNSNLKTVHLSEKIYGTYVIFLNKKNVNDRIMLEFVGNVAKSFLVENII